MGPRAENKHCIYRAARNEGKYAIRLPKSHKFWYIEKDVQLVRTCALDYDGIRVKYLPLIKIWFGRCRTKHAMRTQSPVFTCDSAQYNILNSSGENITSRLSPGDNHDPQLPPPTPSTCSPLLQQYLPVRIIIIIIIIIYW